MCGIAGYLAFDGEPNPACLQRMADALQHRGPDDAGCEAGGPEPSGVPAGINWFRSQVSVGLAHRRLSILDLSPKGHQPMASEDGLHRITYNGEIYNYVELREELRSLGHRFRGNSDTEVVLAAYREWGSACVRRFNGMFAFALWDADQRLLFCARDHLGIKPLHYSIVDGVFYLASETPALVSGVPHDWEIDGQHFLAYLHCMYVPFPHSLVRGIKKLPPASTLIARPDGTVEVRDYWRIEHFGDGDVATAPERFRALLDDAVRLQMRSDVPIGTFLSGGLDSSAMVALLHRQGVVPIHTFSVGYEGHSIDERPFARLVAERAGADHHELLVTASQLESDLDRAIDHLSEPIADSAMLPTFLLCEWARSFGIKVVLNGTGGDEVFGGYSRYRPAGLSRRALEAVSPGARSTLAKVLPGVAGLRLRYRSADLVGAIAGNLGFLEQYFADSTTLDAYCAWLEKETGAAHQAPGPRNPHYQKMHFDLKYYLVDDLLALLDGMGMASAVEGRVPLLDVRLVEHLYSIPEREHFKNGLKSFARQELANLLPPEILNRPKMGFGAPVPYWMQSILPKIRRTMDEGFLTTSLHLSRSPQSLETCVRAADPPVADLWMIFRLYVFERWFQNVFAPARADGLRRHTHA